MKTHQSEHRSKDVHQAEVELLLGDVSGSPSSLALPRSLSLSSSVLFSATDSSAALISLNGRGIGSTNVQHVLNERLQQASSKIMNEANDETEGSSKGVNNVCNGNESNDRLATTAADLSALGKDMADINTKQEWQREDGNERTSYMKEVTRPQHDNHQRKHCGCEHRATAGQCRCPCAREHAQLLLRTG